MGDRTWYYEDCPKCGGQGTVSCYEAISSLIKVDICENEDCDFVRLYDVEDASDVTIITLRKDFPGIDYDDAETKPINK